MPIKNPNYKLEISVIIPIYKAEKFIHRCVDSVLAQTFQDFELILIDDGSPDNCGKICDEYAAKDDRIRVIHQKNQGISATRNRGVAEVKTKYFYFLDSDDYIPPESLETLYGMIMENDADIAVGGLSRVEKGGYIHGDTDRWPEVKTTHDIQLAVLKDKIPNFSWGKLFRTSLWKGINYPVGNVMEDLYVAPRVFYRAKKIVITKESLYFYSHENEGSIMSEGGNRYIRRKYGQFLAWREHERVAREMEPDAVTQCAKEAYRAAIRAYMLNYGQAELNREECDEIVYYLKDHKNLQVKKFHHFAGWMIMNRYNTLLSISGSLQRSIVESHHKRQNEKK